MTYGECERMWGMERVWEMRESGVAVGRGLMGLRRMCGCVESRKGGIVSAGEGESIETRKNAVETDSQQPIVYRISRESTIILGNARVVRGQD